MSQSQRSNRHEDDISDDLADIDLLEATLQLSLDDQYTASYNRPTHPATIPAFPSPYSEGSTNRNPPVNTPSTRSQPPRPPTPRHPPSSTLNPPTPLSPDLLPSPPTNTLTTTSPPPALLNDGSVHQILHVLNHTALNLAGVINALRNDAPPVVKATDIVKIYAHVMYERGTYSVNGRRIKNSREERQRAVERFNRDLSTWGEARGRGVELRVEDGVLVFDD